MNEMRGDCVLTVERLAAAPDRQAEEEYRVALEPEGSARTTGTANPRIGVIDGSGPARSSGQPPLDF